jgi:hypothetical protein
MAEYVCAENEKDLVHLVGRFSDETKNAVKVGPEILSRYVGTYERQIPRGPQELKIALDDAGLTLSIAGGPPRPLTALSATVFIDAGGRLEFDRNDKSEATHFTLIDGSGPWPVVRKK